MFQRATRNQQTLADFQGGNIGIAAESFLVDRKAAGRTQGTIQNYKEHLTHFITYCDALGLKLIGELSADFIRHYLLALAETHNAGGVHGFYRTVRAFLRWIELEEVMPADWRNPIHKVKAPRVPDTLLEPVSLEHVAALIAACKHGENGARDKAIFLYLLDTGVRAMELCNINLDDVDMGTGAVIIRQGKGRKPRTVFIGRKTRRAMRAWLRTRLPVRSPQTGRDTASALFVTVYQERLSYNGLREILRRRSRDAGIPEPTLHQFRRAFAIGYLRNGGDIFTLQQLMGHTTLEVLRRYLKLTDRDTQIAHAKYSPVDRL